MNDLRQKLDALRDEYRGKMNKLAAAAQRAAAVEDMEECSRSSTESERNREAFHALNQDRHGSRWLAGRRRLFQAGAQCAGRSLRSAMPKKKKTLREQAYDTVVRARGSYDAPGFDLCVEAELQYLKAKQK